MQTQTAFSSVPSTFGCPLDLGSMLPGALPRGGRGNWAKIGLCLQQGHSSLC